MRRRVIGVAVVVVVGAFVGSTLGGGSKKPAGDRSGRAVRSKAPAAGAARRIVGDVVAVTRNRATAAAASTKRARPASKANRKNAGSAKKLVERGVVGEAEPLGSVAGVANDACASAEPISGELPFAFDTAAATTDGPPHEACDFFGQTQIENDEWFCWTAPEQACGGEFVVSTCSGTNVDTKIAVYDGCSCPPGDANLLACSDDDCGFQTHLPFVAAPSQNYLIRIGNFPGELGGLGTFKVTCRDPQPCEEPSSNCQGRIQLDALNSNGSTFRVADDFTPATTGSISSVCWWGTYVDDTFPELTCQGVAPDSFELRYFDSVDGRPGSLIASFSQEANTLTVEGPAATGLLIAETLPEFEFTGTHDPVAVAAGQCYWVEVTNPIEGCSWFWEVAALNNERAFQDGLTEPPNGYEPDEAVLQDLAFCLDVVLGDPNVCLPPPPDNDDCVDAALVNTVGDIFFDNAGATMDGPAHAACLAEGQTQLDHDLWYCWTAPCTGDVFVRTCETSDVDTKIAVYDGCACPPTDELLLTCNDDLCGPDLGLQSMVVFSATEGDDYMIRSGTFPGAVGGVGRLSITCGPPEHAACPGSESCCQAVDGPACADETCCESVCACDPFCCDVVWDESCATTGFLGSGCGASLLCNCAAVCGDVDAGDCCEANGSPACADEACCNEVCSIDSFCCDVEWDDFCATTGSVPGGGAEVACGDLCLPNCPAAMLDWMDPLDGTVDARWPHDLGDPALRGIDTIVVGGPLGADPECWTLCETLSKEVANEIASVVENAGTYTITLSRPITPDAVTTITYTDGMGVATTAEFISHAGNANGDGIANADDVIDLGEAFAGLISLPWGLFSADIDNSGAFTPLDILFIVDVFNGVLDLSGPRIDTPIPTADPTCP